MSISRAACWLSAMVLLLPAQAQMSAYGLAAKVNGIGITNEKLERSFEEYLRAQGQNIAAMRYPDRVKAMRRETLDLLIDQELVWQAAQQNNVIATPEEVDAAIDQIRAGFDSPDKFVSRLMIEGYTEASYREHIKHLVTARKYLDSLSSGVEVSDTEVHTFYVENPDRFQVPEVIRARHILLKLDRQADATARKAAREKLTGILAEARKGADFAELAKQYSEDASAAQGGDLGYIPRGRMVQSFERAAFALAPGQLSEVVETDFGLHLILVEDHRAADLVPEEKVREQVRDYLHGQKVKQTEDETLGNLRAGAQIEILAPL